MEKEIINHEKQTVIVQNGQRIQIHNPLTMKKLFLLTSFIFSHLLIFAGNKYAITTSNLNLRESNSKNSISLKVLNQGDTLEILSTDQNWSKVKIDNVEGYVSSEYLSKIEFNSENLGKDETDKKGFKDQIGFVAGFKFVFSRGFIVVLIISLGIYSLRARSKDGRFKDGYRQGKVGVWSQIKAYVFAFIAAILAGFIGGIISIFH